MSILRVEKHCTSIEFLIWYLRGCLHAVRQDIIGDTMNNENKSDFIVIPAPGARYIQGEIVHGDEISLLDLWRILVKRRMLFLGTLIAIIATAAIWIYDRKPIYESRSVLVIGRVAPVGQLEPAQTMIQRLRETYKVDDSSEGRRELPFVKDVDLASKATPDAIEVTVWGNSAAQSQSFLRGVIEKILREHKNLFDIGMSEQNKLLDSLQNNRKEIQGALAEARKKISQPQIDPSISGLLALEMDKLTSQLFDIDQKESLLRLSMSELQSEGTEVIKQPTLPVRPVNPKKALFMAIAIAIGLILGIIMVFIAEFLKKIRDEDSKESNDIALPR